MPLHPLDVMSAAMERLLDDTDTALHGEERQTGWFRHAGMRHVAAGPLGARPWRRPSGRATRPGWAPRQDGHRRERALTKTAYALRNRLTRYQEGIR